MPLSLSLPLPHYDLPRAGRALSALMRDPDDLPQVFTLIESHLRHGAAPAPLRKFRRSEVGRRILRDQPDIVPVLADRAALRALPEGSLGRAYLAFVESEGISPEGIREASLRNREREVPEAFAYLHCRMRDTHDLWHAATGYKGDVQASSRCWRSRSRRTGTPASPSSSSRRSSRASGDGDRDDPRRVPSGPRRGLAPGAGLGVAAAAPADGRCARASSSAPRRDYVALRTTELRAQGML